MDLSDQGIKDDLSRIRSILQSIARPPIDIENLTMDIWMEGWTKGMERISNRMIRSRCYDQLRRLKLERDHLLATPNRRVLGTSSGDEEGVRTDYLNVLGRTCSLSTSDTEILFRIFYLQETVQQAAQSMNQTPYAIERQLKEVMDRLKAANRGMR